MGKFGYPKSLYLKIRQNKGCKRIQKQLLNTNKPVCMIIFYDVSLKPPYGRFHCIALQFWYKIFRKKSIALRWNFSFVFYMFKIILNFLNLNLYCVFTNVHFLLAVHVSHFNTKY